jgi:plasmid replication initiation protein
MKKKDFVVQSNSLTKASYRLTLTEQRLILACIAQIKNPKQTITEDDEFEITVPYFSRLFGVPLNNTYHEINLAATALLGKIVFIENPEPNNKKLLRRGINWLSRADYYDAKVIVRFNKDMTTYLSNLTKGCFTQYHIQQIEKIKTVYGIRLYSILVSESWKIDAYSNDKYEVEIDELRDMFQFNKDEYERIYDFKKYVLDPAIKSINKHTNVQVEYLQKKTGRTITHIVFKYSINSDDKTKKITKSYIEKNARPGETWDQARARLLNQQK